MNESSERVACNYCQGINESTALECRHCGAALAVSTTASALEAKGNQARELLKRAVQHFEEAGKNFGDARKHFESARESLDQTDD